MTGSTGCNRQPGSSTRARCNRSWAVVKGVSTNSPSSPRISSSSSRAWPTAAGTCSRRTTMQARFVHGRVSTVNHTPDADVSAGAVIVEGSTCYIAHRSIAAGELGAVAARGGVYDVQANGGSGGDEIPKG